MEKVAKVLVGMGVYILLPFAIIKVSWELATSWIEELIKWETSIVWRLSIEP
jgi:hypothetical protein